jgi:maltose-binding protein MalE
VKDMTQQSHATGSEASPEQELGKPSKNKGSSLIVDLACIGLIVGALLFWFEVRSESLIEQAIEHHLAESSHQKVAVLDYSEIQDAFASEIKKGQVEAFILAKKDQIERLIKEGYVVLDGNMVVGAPQSSQYVIKR